MTKKLTKPALATPCATPVFLWLLKEAPACQAPLSDRKKIGVNDPSFLPVNQQNNWQKYTVSIF